MLVGKTKRYYSEAIRKQISFQPSWVRTMFNEPWFKLLLAKILW